MAAFRRRGTRRGEALATPQDCCVVLPCGSPIRITARADEWHAGDAVFLFLAMNSCESNLRSRLKCTLWTSCAPAPIPSVSAI